jgi:hypothetical protein
MAGFTKSLGAGDLDAYLVKVDDDGNKVWERTYGGISSDVAHAIQQTTDNGLIFVGSTSSFPVGPGKVFLVKTDSNGDSLWMRAYGDIGGMGYAGGADCIQQTADGGYIIAGEIFISGPSGADSYLMKTDASGNVEWDVIYHWPDYQWCNSVLQTPDGGYIMTGKTALFSSPDEDLLLMKTNADGDSVWARTYGEPRPAEGGECGELTPDGGYIATGYTTGTADSSFSVYVVRTTASGDTLWTGIYEYGFPGQAEHGHSIIHTVVDSGYVIAGECTRDFGNADVLLLKIDANGQALWSAGYGGTGTDRGYCVKETPDHGYVIAGTSNSTFGAGSWDAYLIKTAPDPLAGVSEEWKKKESGVRLWCLPNPARQGSAITYQLPSSEYVRISIMNVAGQVVRQIAGLDGAAGSHTAFWDGTDCDGHRVSPGVYFIRLEAGEQVVSKKVVLVR